MPTKLFLLPSSFFMVMLIYSLKNSYNYTMYLHHFHDPHLSHRSPPFSPYCVFLPILNLDIKTLSPLNAARGCMGVGSPSGHGQPSIATHKGKWVSLPWQPSIANSSSTREAGEKCFLVHIFLTHSGSVLIFIRKFMLPPRYYYSTSYLCNQL